MKTGTGEFYEKVIYILIVLAVALFAAGCKDSKTDKVT
jgi:hypothetical protein